MRACQFWELARDAQLLGRTVPLATLDGLLQRAMAPPPEVVARRARVRARLQLEAPEQAGAVLPNAGLAHDPGRELLFRDFCEALVRVAHARCAGCPANAGVLGGRLQEY